MGVRGPCLGSDQLDLRLALAVMAMAIPVEAHAHGTEIALSFLVPLVAQPFVFWAMVRWSNETGRPRWATSLVFVISLVAVVWLSSTKFWPWIWNQLADVFPVSVIFLHAAVLGLLPAAIAVSASTILFRGISGSPAGKGEIP
jgi:hypothetical protein